MCIRDRPYHILLYGQWIHLTRPVAVSYTHLDVYKRQLIDICMWKLITIPVIHNFTNFLLKEIPPLPPPPQDWLGVSTDHRVEYGRVRSEIIHNYSRTHFSIYN